MCAIYCIRLQIVISCSVRVFMPVEIGWDLEIQLNYEGRHDMKH